MVVVVQFIKFFTSFLFLNTVYTHTHPFNGPLSRTTRVSRGQKGRTNLDFTGARDSEWQWHQLGHMQVCTSLQTDSHASTPPLSFFTGRMPFLPPNQQCQSIIFKHCMFYKLVITYSDDLTVYELELCGLFGSRSYQ